MSGLSLLPNLFNKQVCLLGKPTVVIAHSLAKRDGMDNFFKQNCETLGDLL